MFAEIQKRYCIRLLPLGFCLLLVIVAKKKEWGSLSFLAAKKDATQNDDNPQKPTSPSSPPDYFWDALAALTNALHDDPVELGARPWSFVSNSSASWTFDGISSRLIRNTFHDKRLVLLGDSTLLHLHRWLQTVAMDMSDDEVDAFHNMSVDRANEIIQTRMLFHQETFRRPTIQDVLEGGETENSIKNGTVIVWDGYTGSTWENACQFGNDFWDRTRRVRPDIMVVNFGLHWLHLQGGGRDIPICYAYWWIHYEEWLEQAFQVAQASHTKLLLFKTTNFMCESKFTDHYTATLAKLKIDRVQLQKDLQAAKGGYQISHSDDGTHHNTPMFNICAEQLDRMITSNASLASPRYLSREDLYRYCSEGTFDEEGVRKLNARMVDFVQRKQEELRVAAASTAAPPPPTVAVFNDHDLESCLYTTIRDGRHYRALNLVRIRVMANMIQALFPPN